MVSSLEILCITHLRIPAKNSEDTSKDVEATDHHVMPFSYDLTSQQI
jgi:hypothetical protein